MLMQAVDTYLAMRRAVGFALDHTEGYLRNFARFALARGDTHIVVTTAVDWAARTTSEGTAATGCTLLSGLRASWLPKTRVMRFHPRPLLGQTSTPHAVHL